VTSRRTIIDLERGRAAYAQRSWRAAHEALARAGAAEPLEPEDLELLTTALMMLAREDEATETLEQAHRLYVERGQTLRAARAATWIGLNLAYRGLIGPASGWLRRAERLLEAWPEQTAEHGLLLLPLVFRHEAAGAFAAAAAVALAVPAVCVRPA